jgi:hypothetical protein
MNEATQPTQPLQPAEPAGGTGTLRSALAAWPAVHDLEAAGVPVRSYQQWDQGRRTFSFETAVKLADALDCSLDELAGREWSRGKGKRGGRP